MFAMTSLRSVVRAWNRTGLYRPAIWITQICVFALCIVSAFLLRFEFTVPAPYRRYLYCAFLIWIPVKLIVFRLLDLDRGWWRFVSIYDLLRLAAGNAMASLLGGVLALYLGPAGFPRSLPILDLILCFLATAAQRVSVRLLVDLVSAEDVSPGPRIFIYGAGMGGLSLLREIRSNPKLHYSVRGFIDDNPRKRGLTIQGLRVRGTGEQLKELAARHRVSEVLIAVPSASGAQMTRILGYCHGAGLKFRTIPALVELIENSTTQATQIREVKVEDLLGRSPVRLDEQQIRASLEARIVLVTGAAGSIGSELCRQLARFHPAGIVALDTAESPLFELDREMKETFPGTPFHPVVGSVQNLGCIEETLRHFHPKTVFHAAAYKHVPLMETHVFEAIENNVFGTYNIASAAAEHGVEEFVLISSDKAVHPTNVMGATKRVAELILLALQDGDTRYVAVRFGNVLGSNGSVIPIFRKQIAAGGPVTVTHPEMRRFFMTIPEACQLVLQAAVIGEGGQICVLDMGEPVKISDLASNMILLSGLRPGEDVKIEFTGIRPGEKLCEELSMLVENTLPTEHEKIRIYSGPGMSAREMAMWLDELHDICRARDAGRLVVALKELVPDYSPSAHLLKRSIEMRERPYRTASAGRA